MAVKQVTQVHCDRCGKIIEDGKAKDPTATHLIYVEGSLLTDATKIDFVDLCAKCESRSKALLAQLALAADDSVKGDDGSPAVGDNAAAASSQKPITPKADKSAPAKT
jgi:hypothetical protein